MSQDKAARTKRKIEVDGLRTFARIEEMKDGGPIIDLITGREPHLVGTKSCIKAGMRSMPWESVTAELPMIELCETASPVRALLSQPHELFMKVTGESRQWMYRPDLRLTVDRVFGQTVLGGVPFAKAVANWRPGTKVSETMTLIVEVKGDDDPRLEDPVYDRKIELARQVYEAINWRFIWVDRSPDIDHPAIATSVREIMLDHDVSITPADITTARAVLGEARRATLRELTAALGGGGIGKAAALHVRRIVSIDMNNDLRPDTVVVRMPDDMAIFEVTGQPRW
ncbi:hypothetical protein [Devosia sp. A369]